MKQKRLMLLGGIRKLLLVIEVAYKLRAYGGLADYLPANIVHRHDDENNLKGII